MAEVPPYRPRYKIRYIRLGMRVMLKLMDGDVLAIVVGIMGDRENVLLEVPGGHSIIMPLSAIRTGMFG